jgi:hypothetical protein
MKDGIRNLLQEMTNLSAILLDRNTTVMKHHKWKQVIGLNTGTDIKRQESIGVNNGTAIKRHESL